MATPLAVAVALALAGCGGPSEEEFVAQADQVCRQAQAQASRVRRPAVNAGSGQTVAYIRRLAALSRREFVHLSALEPPERLKPRFDAFLASGRQGARLLDQLADTTRTGDLAASERVVRELEALTSRANRQALAVGLRRCGS
jgi:hypothetical protein